MLDNNGQDQTQPQASTQPQAQPQPVAQAAPGSVPMIAPDYSSTKMVPPDQANAARQAGWEPAVKMVGTDGQNRWIPQSKVTDARASNMAVTPDNQGVTKMAGPNGGVTYALPTEVSKFKDAGHTLITDSDNPNYDYQNKALTPEEMQQLQKANLDRPLLRKILGLPSNDPTAQAIQEKDLAHQTEGAQHSGFVKQQITDKAIGGGLVAAAPAIIASGPAAAAGYEALTAPAVASETVGTGLLDEAGNEITKSIVKYGPSVIRQILSKSGGTLARAGGAVARTALAHPLETLLGIGMSGDLAIRWLDRSNK